MDNDENSALPDHDDISICEAIGAYLDESNDDKEKRLSKIQALTDFLAYERRITELTDIELQHFLNCLDGPQLTDGMRATLDKCKTEERRNYYIDMWARSTYFARCAWLTYLHTGKDKPIVFQKEATATIEASAS